ncbi:MAG TPA: hypothetical protein VN794_21800, partial [Methylomirabilota bacterium]|nr:hypothetical protein [Methylomirabilota bacterium]
MAYVFPPVPVDLATHGTLPPAGLNANGQVRGGPFLFGGAMYLVLETGVFPATTADVFKSLDNGQTWAGVDIGGSDSNGNFGCSFDGAHTIRICFSGGEVTIEDTTIQDFDLSTETWGPSIGGGPDSEMVWAAQFLGNGNYMAILSYDSDDHLGDPFRGAVWNGASWGPVFVVNQNALDDIGRPLTFPDLQFTFCMSADGLVMHAFFPWQDAATIDTLHYICYQAINADGTLGPFVPATAAEGNFGLQAQPPNPVVYGDFIVAAHTDQVDGFQSLWIGTPVSNPVFFAAPPFDPGYPLDTTLTDSGNG